MKPYSNIHIYLGTLTLLSVLHLTLSSQSTYQCDVYHCAHENLLPNQCIYPVPRTTKNETQEYDISLNCKTNQYCPQIFDSSNKTCIDHIPPTNQIPGQTCRNNTDCASNICNSNICKGLPAASSCLRTEQCQIGYYCGKTTDASVSNNCIKQLSLNQTCSEDTDCINNAGCNPYTKKCTEYFSATNGTMVGSDGSLLCKSMKVINNMCVSLRINGGYECSERNGMNQTECDYSVVEFPDFPEGLVKNVKTACRCSRAYAERAFCEYDTEHEEWVGLVKELKEYYLHDAGVKHSAMRHSYDSMLKKRYVMVSRFPEFKDADRCAVDIEVSGSMLVLGLSYGFVGMLVCVIFGLF